jgi:phospholipid-binding lipoprotein MlaA
MLALKTAMLFAGTLAQAQGESPSSAAIASPPRIGSPVVVASATGGVQADATRAGAPAPGLPLDTPMQSVDPTVGVKSVVPVVADPRAPTPLPTVISPPLSSSVVPDPVLPAGPQPQVPGMPTVIVPAAESASNPASGQDAGRVSESATHGDIVIVGRKQSPGDPLRAVNAKAFAATDAVDSAVIGPVALAYKRRVPSPIRRGIHNFLYNLREPVVFLNFLLQFKPGKAAETVGRFAINSTVGALGMLDVAKKRPFRLPRRSNGFANTLGYHGVKNGPFLFLPLVGPTTVRDLIGGALDRLILPVAVGKPFTSPTYTVPAGVLGALDHRADFDEVLHDLHDNSPDPYAASREFYLRRRQAEIDHLHGRNLRKPVSADFRGNPTGKVPEQGVDSSVAPAVRAAGAAVPRQEQPGP